MAFNSSNLSLNTLLKIWQRGGIVDQLPAHSEIWKLIMKKKTGVDQGRQVNFEIMTGKGLGAIQGGNFGGILPVARRVDVAEYTAHYKLTEMAVSYDEDLERRLKGGDASYARPFARELDAKKAGAAQIKSVEVLGDGMGVIGVLTAKAVVSTSADTAVFTISATSANAGKSHIGWILPSDLVKFVASDGTAHGTINNTNTNVSYWKILSVDIANNQFTASAYNSSDALINLSDATIGATDPSSGDYIVRLDTSTFNYDTYASDYNLACEVGVGLESLSANDGRTVHGMTMSGLLAGTRKDCNGAVLDGEKFIDLLSKANQILGAEEFKAMKYSDALMYNGTYDNLIKDGAAQRQFVNVRDVETGLDNIGARYMKTAITFTPDPYVQSQRVWVLPNSADCLEYLGTDFEEMSDGQGKKGHRNINSSGRFKKEIVRFFQSGGVLLSRKPSSLLALEDFA